ncbi:hypothetical protein C731_3692 [Mycolicibacterium hassiacum DSM 44199]|uniref:Uncharacterized protein n=2 Tax=Mycolicibacterium hassiacum TaxID=46351 RepID=K5BAG6_MYCHD|nr:hypothetical protein C731_3692 [Mycolicibacterium hassiacum DSM 44199]MBX5487407.1 hypothetical protein [Mycolicibacterium hassiacum]MDA4087522.1 hypothetical protein [Mycolicibacterium hassiacum DSM 44199]PZN18976.1 MAG: hypothetical protein DIU75_15805 [Mycolicibacterium hassiacum]VCT91854.1 hypothetical protein MHAS_03573 [Mycolicibacterium hassiacum DSM 44199]
MHAHTRRIPTKLAAMAVAAGVATAGVPALVPGDASEAYRRSVVSADVMPASAVTDALFELGKNIDLAVRVVSTPAGLPFALPVDALAAALVGLQNPQLTPSLISHLIQMAANPSDHTELLTYAYMEKDALLELIVQLPVIGPALAEGIDEWANAFGDALAASLPDPVPAELALYGFTSNTAAGRTVEAIKAAALIPVRVPSKVVYYLGWLPALVSATVEAALTNPADIPGLVSNLVHTAVGVNGLVGMVVTDVTEPLVVAPAPVGEFGTAVRAAIFNVINTTLDRTLPPPIAPPPFDSGEANANALAAEAPETAVASGRGSLESAGRGPGSFPIATSQAAEGPVAAVGESTPSQAGARQTDQTRPAPTRKPGAALKHPVRKGVENLKLGNKFVPGKRGKTAEPAGADKPTPIGETGSTPGGDGPASSATSTATTAGPDGGSESTDSAA